MDWRRSLDLLTEVVMAILGLLLVYLAAAERFRPPAGLGLWIGVGAALVLWGGRIWLRGHWGDAAGAWMQRIRGASLVLAGAAMLAMVWMPVGRSQITLIVVGGILALRGVACAALAAGSGRLPSRKPPSPR